MAASALIGAWLAGFLGGVHCIAMCGGFLTAIAGHGVPAAAQGKLLLQARVLARRQLPYNLGRITTYALLGAIAGNAGALALVSTASLIPVQRVLFVIANMFLLGSHSALPDRGIGLQGCSGRRPRSSRRYCRPRGRSLPDVPAGHGLPPG